LINDLLVHLKWLLINRRPNAEIEQEVARFAREWKARPGADSCALSGQR
jgi:hypothetical protein